MNDFSFNDLEIGFRQEFEAHIDHDQMQKFMEITGDVNPLHRDEVFAQEHGYPDTVVYGMLSASYLSTLAGVYLPGKQSLIHYVEIKFIKPVFPRDTLHIRGEVTELNDIAGTKQMTLKVEIRNDKDEKVIRGKMKIGFLEK